MASEKRLKAINRKWLLGYLAINGVVLATFIGFICPSFANMEEFLSKLQSPGGYFSLILFPIIIVLEGLFSSNMKNIIIFHKIKNPLPASRAFSYFAKNDPRIDESEISWLFPGGVPDDPKKQNSQWYNLYRKHEKKHIVQDSHRYFLLTRDLMALTILLIPICLIIHLLWDNNIKLIICHCLALLVIATVISVSAKHYGERLVENVLVEATQNNRR